MKWYRLGSVMSGEIGLDGLEANESGAHAGLQRVGFVINRSEPMLLQCVDEALADLLGCRARKAVYDHLERQLYLARDQIPRRMSEFSRVLEANFGKGGATIERAIARKFYLKLEMPFVIYPGFRLEDYVRKAGEERRKTKAVSFDAPRLSGRAGPEEDSKA